MILDVSYSPTHQRMAERFLIPTAKQHGLRVRARQMHRNLKGEWDAPGTMEMGLSKFAELLFCEPCTGDLRMASGVDIVFLQEWPAWCEAFMRENEYLMCWAWDSHVPCMDFIAFFDTLEARLHLLNGLWQTFAVAQQQTPAGSQDLAFVNNQFVNAQLLQSAPFKWGCFPDDVVVNWPAISRDQTIWNGQPIALPPTARAFHANWTVGVANKTAMLEQVMRARQHSHD